MQFPATEVNDTNSASVILSNKGSKLQLFEFGVPAGSHLQVTPRVGCLKPNSSIRLQLDFAPPLGLMQQQAGGTATASTTAATTAAAPSDQPTLQQQQQQQDPVEGLPGGSSSGGSDNRWSWFREWLLPCYVRPAESHDDLAALGHMQTSSSSGSVGTADVLAPQLGNKTTATTSTTSSKESSVNVLHLAVTTCAVAPELQLVPPELPKPPGKNYFVMDFGALPVGERVTKQLELANNGGYCMVLQRCMASSQQPAVDVSRAVSIHARAGQLSC